MSGGVGEMVSSVRAAVLAADAAGDLVGAGEQAQRLVLAASRGGDVRAQIDALLLLARVSRHRRDAVSLRWARDAAGVAVQLTELPRLAADRGVRAAAALELAACLVAGGRHDEGFAIAGGHRSDVEAAIAGWAWTTMGQARLAQGRTREAVAALSNALAGFEREPGGRRAFTARVWLAVALTRVGDLEHGAGILEADLEYWRGSGLVRLQVEHHLALAESLRQRGLTAQARTVLGTVADLLRPCMGMDAVAVRLHQQWAACDLDWHQTRAAQNHVIQAERIRARLMDAGARPAALGVPRPSAVQELGARTPVPNGGPYRDLADAARELADTMASEVPDVAGVSAFGGAVALSLNAEVRGLIARARRSRSLDDDGAAVLFAQLESLGAVPDTERLEATLLVRAGELLHSLDESRSVGAERLLRRALVRLDRLPGMGLWRARAEVALAMTLRDAGRPDEALPYALRGVETLDAERFEMDARRTRSTWGKHQNAAFDCAIDLAHRCGRTDIAADLIIFSRAAGVVTESMKRLVPVPRLHYIDGTTSTLGRSEPTLFA